VFLRKQKRLSNIGQTLQNPPKKCVLPSQAVSSGPKMVAPHTNRFSSPCGLALQPSGGSWRMDLRSDIRRSCAEDIIIASAKPKSERARECTEEEQVQSAQLCASKELSGHCLLTKIEEVIRMSLYSELDHESFP
jgi:hypothetical protein